MQSMYIDQSVEIAYYIQKEFVDIKRLDRGVRQAIFWVLHQVKMPSILVELGFITNPSEENFLLSEEGQKKLANCIFDGFERYKHEYDKRTITTPQTENITIEENKETKQHHQEEKTEKNKTKKATTENNQITYKIQVFSSRTLIAKNNSDYRKLSKYQPISHFIENGWYKYTCGDCQTYNEAQERLKEIQEIFDDAIIVAFENDKKISINKAKNKEPKIEQKTNSQPNNEASKSNITFRIQVFSSRNIVPQDNLDMRRIQKHKPIHHFEENGWHKYTCTETTSYEEAKENLKKIQEIFKDAIIVAFDNDKKISIQEALKK